MNRRNFMLSGGSGLILSGFLTKKLFAAQDQGSSMTMIKPKMLRPGATVGLISPQQP